MKRKRKPRKKKVYEKKKRTLLSPKVAPNSRAFLFENWTEAAVDCYERHCICTNCIIEDICQRQSKDNEYGMPPMKFIVLKLYEKYGKPTAENYKPSNPYVRSFEQWIKTLPEKPKRKYTKRKVKNKEN